MGSLQFLDIGVKQDFYLPALAGNISARVRNEAQGTSLREVESFIDIAPAYPTKRTVRSTFPSPVSVCHLPGQAMFLS